MLFTIDTGAYDPNKTKAHCPTCQKQVEVNILNEYTHYTSYFHEECQTEWTFSSYEQCEILREMNYQSILSRRESMDKTEKKLVKFWVKGIMGSLGLAGAFALTGGLAAIPAAIIIGGTSADQAEKSLTKSSQRHAKGLSYNLDEYFKELSNHHLDEKFRKEARYYLTQ